MIADPNYRFTGRGRGFSTPRLLTRLLTGIDFDFLGGPTLTDEQLRATWERHRAAIMPQWIPGELDHAKPFERPWAWWRWDSPEPRRRIDGKPHPFDTPGRDELIRQRVRDYPERNEDLWQVAYESYYGETAVLIHPDDFNAEYESQRDYLIRLDLLAPEERQLLAAENKNTEPLTHSISEHST